MTALKENEHTLSSPALIGTDDEKIRGIQFWADAVALLRSLNIKLVSYENKMAIITAFQAELDTVKQEIDNVSAVAVDGAAQVPAMVQGAGVEGQAPPPDQPAPEEVVDLAQPEPAVAPLPRFSSEAIKKLQRMAGVN